MTFRVGLLFYSNPTRHFVPGPVIDLLQKIDRKTESARNGQELTLMPYIRTSAMALFSNSVIAGGGYAVEAAAFDEAGVTLGPFDVFDKMRHPEYNELSDFSFGMNVLLARCDVIVIICKDESDASEVRTRLEAHHNTSVLLALVPIQSGRPSFLEVNPLPTDKDGPSWLLAITERWEVKDATASPLPTRKRTVIGFLFPIFYSAIIGRWSETVKKRKPTEADRCRAGMGLSEGANKKLELSDRDSLEAVLDAVCPYFVGHDALGRHYSNVFRTTCFLVPLLIVVSTVLAVASAIDHVRHEVYHIFEGVLLLVAALLFLRSKIAKHHRKWVENRLLAEFLRLTLFNEVFHTIPRLSLPAEESELWVDRSRMFLKHLRALPPVIFVTPKAELLSARISVIADFASYQSAWHMDFAAQHRAAGKRLTRMSAYAFVITLCLCVFQLLIANNLEAMTSYKEAVDGIPHILTMLTLISASGAFVLSLLSHQLGFEAVAERSRNAAEHFEVLWQAIKSSGHTADAGQVYAWVHECAGAILAEQHSWYRQIPLIRMHL